MPARSIIQDDPGAGSVFRLADGDGARFPRGSFRAIAFEQSTTVALVEGDNLEYPFVQQVLGDQLRVTRGDTQAPISDGWIIALLTEVPKYELGRSVTIRGHFAEPGEPYTVHVRDPQGRQAEHGTADGVSWDTDAVAAYSFEPQYPGLWSFRWRSSTLGELDDSQFYVDRSSSR